MTYILVIDHIATGGAERILIDYYHYLEAKGCKVCVFVLSGHEGQSQWTNGVNVIYGSRIDEDNIIRKTVQQTALYFKLNHLVKHVKPDVVFSFLEKSNLLTSIVRTKAVKVMTVHNVLSIQYTKVRDGFVRKALYGMIRWMYNRCGNVVAVSKQVKDDLVASFGIKSDNIYVINNYVNRGDIRKKSKDTTDNFVFVDGVRYIMNVGRFSNQKAQWKLLKAFSLYVKGENKDNVHLVLMGHGEYIDRLKQLADSLGISDKVTFLPFNVNPYKYMKHAHLFVLSSIYEGFPIVLAEASSLRIPFVGTRKAVPEEMFDDKEFWETCIFDSITLTADFSTEIHEDERCLAALLKKGVEDEAFRNKILKHTSQWESCNDKLIQFCMYDELCENREKR